MTRWIAVGLVMAGIMLSGIAVVPSGLERAFMLLRDNDFTQATQSFEQRWKRGDHSREVANALAELYVRLGDTDKAAEVLVQFVAENPNDRPALARLAEIFRDGQRRDKHIVTLERLWKQKHDFRLLRSLERLYELADREDDRIKALTVLVHSPVATISDHEELSSLLAPRNPTQALETLFNAFKRWPTSVDVDTAQTFVALAADSHREDLIKTVIAQWVKQKPSYASIEPLAVTLISKRLDSLALDTVLVSGALAMLDPATIILAARIESKLRKFDQAFSRLELLRAANKLPSKGDDVYVETAIFTKHRDLALAHILTRGPGNLPFWLQSWVVTKARDVGDNDFLVSLKAAFENTKGVAKSFMMGRIEHALGDRKLAQMFAERAKLEVVDQSSGIAVAGLFADLGINSRALELLLVAAPDAAHVPIDDLPQAATVALSIKEAQLALAFSSALREARPSTSSDIIFARALGLSKRTDEALEMLDEIESWSEEKELAVFEVLKGADRFSELQKKLCERMDAEDATLSQRTNYAFMLNDFKTFEAKEVVNIAPRIADDLDDSALEGPSRLSRIELLSKIEPMRAKPYAKEAAEIDPDHAAYIYLSLLKNLHLKQEAIDFLSSAIDDVESEATRQSFLYQWIELGITKPAIPFLRELASESNKEWFFAYDDALTKLGERATRLKFLEEYARRPGLDKAFKGQLASEILEAGGKDVAIALFKDDAANAPANSPAVEQLLYLWGPRPPQEGIEWLATRARSAEPKERELWLQRMLQSGATETVTSITADFYVQGHHELAPIYAEALAQSKMDQQLKQLLKTEMATGTLPTSIALRLAQSAEERSLSREASTLFEMASTKDKQWLVKAGKNAWYAGQHARARSILGVASELPRADAETFFLLAEATRVEGKKFDLQRLYSRSLELASTNPGNDAKRIRLLSLVRLGRYDDAQVMMENEENSTLRADYAAALLDSGKIQQAAKILVPNPHR